MKKVLFCIAALCAAATGGFAQSFSAATYNVRQLNAGDDARGDGWERRLPVIAGGMIREKEDVMALLKAGVTSVSSTNPEIWFE